MLNLRSYCDYDCQARQEIPGRYPLAVENLKRVFIMYAIVEIAGQQFKVEAGNEIFCNRLPDAKGAAVEFTKVLLVENAGEVKVGAPYVEGASVKATVLADDVRAVKANPDAHPLFHSDRGFQYTSRAFHQKLVQAGMTQSMCNSLKATLFFDETSVFS